MVFMTAPNPFEPSFMPPQQTRARMIFVGVTLLVLGVLAILTPLVSTLVATIVIGILLIVGGCLRLFHVFGESRPQSTAWLIVSSILYICAGAAVLWNPLIGTLSLTLVIGTFLVVGAVSKAIHAYQYRGTHTSGWLIFDAIIGGALGILLVAGLPTTAFWALGAIVGVDLIVGGIAFLGLASQPSIASIR